MPNVTSNTQSVRQSPYSLLVPQLNKANSNMKAAQTPADREKVLEEIKQNPELLDAFLKQGGDFNVDGTGPSVAPNLQYNEMAAPQFEAAYEEKLTYWYNILTTGDIKVERERALADLKKTPEALKEFMRKTLPPSCFLPRIEENPDNLEGMLVPTIEKIYHRELTRLYEEIRAAGTPEEREKVFEEVVTKPHLLQEFLKNNVPQLCHL